MSRFNCFCLLALGMGLFFVHNVRAEENAAPTTATDLKGPPPKLPPLQFPPNDASNKEIGPKQPDDANSGFLVRAYHRAKERLATDMDLGFVHAFLSSITMVIVSELGDKTFFIAAIMAMRHARLTVFLGAIGALGLMTVLSAVLGFATTIIPKSVTHIIASALFLVFGLKMLHEGYKMSADEGREEYEEVQADLKKREAELESGTSIVDPESGTMTRTPSRRWFHGFVSAIFLQSFILTFLAEWGDRSQITTIILAAREEVIGVIIGGTLGHALCTGLAVLGGRIVAQKISVRTVTLIGGVVFIIFAFSSFIVGD